MGDFRRQYEIPPPTGSRSLATDNTILPIAGATPMPDIMAPPESMVSGQNMWVRQGQLEPRWRLSQISMTNPAVAISNATKYDFPRIFSSGNTNAITGAFVHQVLATSGTPAIDNVLVACAPSTFRVGVYDSNLTVAWYLLSYVSSTGSNIPPSSTIYSNWFSSDVYSLSRNANMAIIVGESNETVTYVWPSRIGGGSSYTAFSHLTGAPGAQDVATFDNRPVVWNCATRDGTAAVPTRVQWSVAGDPEDWTGLGSGFEDLVDMRGVGTRIFTQDDELVLFSTDEIWRGRKVGFPFIFSFSPINRTIGAPYPRACLQTPLGIFWLGADFMIRNLSGEAVTEVSAPFQEYFRANLSAPETTFFTYNYQLRQLRFFYSTANTSPLTQFYPTEALVYNIESQTWHFEHYGIVFHRGLSAPLTELSLNLSTPLSFVIGLPWRNTELLFTSAGSMCYRHPSATSDLGASTSEDAVFGTLQDDDPRNMKVCDEVRVDLSANRASTLTYSLSPNNGVSYSYTSVLSVSATSATTQRVLYPKIAGNYFVQRLQSTNGAWKIPRINVRFTPDGEAR